MQTVKSFIFIILLFNSFNVLSKVCLKSSGASIPNSTFIKEGQKGQGKCTCNSGYSPSGFSGISISSKNEFNNNAKCTEKNNWVVPLAISGGALVAISGGALATTAIIAGVDRYRNRYKAYKARKRAGNRVNSEDSEEPWEGWEGTESEYLQSDSIYNRPLKGAYRIDNLEDPSPYYPLLKKQSAALKKANSDYNWQDSEASAEPQIKYDPGTDANIVADSDGRVLSRWNTDSKSWVPARGAERWRYSDRLGYKVIANNDDNFLNPTTNSFQTDEWVSTWKGRSLSDYINDFKVKPELQGRGDPLSFADNYANKTLDKDFDLQSVQATNEDDAGSVMKYNQSDQSNVLVDKQDRLLKSWNRVDKRWEPADGAERWRYSDTFQHNVISKENNDFLNPRTGKFETIPTDNKWSGEFMARTYSKEVESVELEGVGEPLNVTSDMEYNGTYDSDIAAQYTTSEQYQPNGKINILNRDLNSNESVLTDSNKRLLARWNRGTQDWDTVEGSSRWRFSKTFKYKVVSKTDSDFYNPTSKEFQEIPHDNPPWKGSISEYTEHPSISSHSLKGVGEPLEGLTDPKESAELSLQRQNTSAYNFAQNRNIRIKFDPASGENVVVDSNKRVLARWDAGEGANEWKAVDGAERWEFHPKFGYDVVATDSTNGIATNYLNPHTGKFVDTKDEGWEEDSMESSDIFGADAAPAARGRVIAIVHKNKAYFEEEIYEDDLDGESGITDFQFSSPLSPAASLEGKELDDFDLFEGQTVNFDSDADSDIVLDLDEYSEWDGTPCVI